MRRAGNPEGSCTLPATLGGMEGCQPLAPTGLRCCRPGRSAASPCQPLTAARRLLCAGLRAGREALAAGALSLPSSARQREQAAALEAALDHSSLEVQDLLAALDATAGAASAAAAAAEGDAPAGGAAAAAQPDRGQVEAAEEAVLTVRRQLAEAHEGVQAARRRMGEAAGEAEALKRQHAAVREQVGGGAARRGAGSIPVGAGTALWVGPPVFSS